MSDAQSEERRTSSEHTMLYVVSEEEGGPERLSDRPDRYIFSRPAREDEVTLEAMAEMLGQDAEGGNYHDFVRIYPKLAAMIAEESNRDIARRVMRRIVDAGGLHP